jgi:hypothetical protein
LRESVEKALREILKHFDPTAQAGIENLVSVMFAGLCFLYATIFLGDVYVFVKGEVLRKIPEIGYVVQLVGALIVVLPAFYARAFIFSQDRLATGRNRYAEFFRQLLPSRYLAQELQCGQNIANEIWFSVFNTWRSPDHPRHSQWLSTFRRTYSCRFVYYLQRWLLGASLVFLVTLALDGLYRRSWAGDGGVLDGMWFVKAALVVTTFCGGIYIRLTNRIGPRPTGCWFQLKEIEEIHQAWLQENIVGPSNKKIDRARDLVKQILKETGPQKMIDAPEAGKA